MFVNKRRKKKDKIEPFLPPRLPFPAFLSSFPTGLSSRQRGHQDDRPDVHVGLGSSRARVRVSRAAHEDVQGLHVVCGRTPVDSWSLGTRTD